MKLSVRQAIGNAIVSLLSAFWIVSCSSTGNQATKVVTTPSIDSPECQGLMKVVVEKPAPDENIAQRIRQSQGR